MDMAGSLFAGGQQAEAAVTVKDADRPGRAPEDVVLGWGVVDLEPELAGKPPREAKVQLSLPIDRLMASAGLEE
eukprot:954378-Prymnesium_polylepis.1